MVLRQYQTGDRASVLVLLQRGYPEEAWTDLSLKKFLSKRSRNNHIRILGCEDNSLIYGVILFTLERSYCSLRRLVIHPEARRKKLGTFAVTWLASSPIMGNRRRMKARVHERNTVGAVFLRSGAAGLTVDTETARRYDENREYWYNFAADLTAIKQKRQLCQKQ